MNIKDTGKVGAKTKMIDGKKYLLCSSDGDKELWLPFEAIEIKKKVCSVCGYDGVALESHHIHGRKNSDETIIVCANCHREIHNRMGYKL